MNVRENQPSTKLVSVGLPVRNGGDALRGAIESIIKQDYRDIELIISDNRSVDYTQQIAREYAQKDSRIIYYRQPHFLTVSENFMFVLRRARGEFFMWAAHDDRRSNDYISSLLKMYEFKDDTILTFGDCYVTRSLGQLGTRVSCDFENVNLSKLGRIRKATTPALPHLYGLWRTDALKSVNLKSCVWAWDQPLMIAAAYLGIFRYVPGAAFVYYSVDKSHLDRAIYQDGLKKFNKYVALSGLIYATFLTLRRSGGIVVGAYAAALITLSHARNLPSFFLKKLQITAVK